ncbi:MAG: nucleotide sugar dehydrogenase, partial [Acidilobaceae archaeon]
ARKLGVIGGGFVGVNVAVLAALRGFEVVVVDTNKEVVEAINRGDSRVRDYFVEENWGRVRDRIKATLDYSELSDAQRIVVAVNTPLKAHGRELVKLIENDEINMDSYIDLKPLEEAGRRLGEVVKPGTLIASETTIYPAGTAERLVTYFVAVAGESVAEKVSFVHSPERLVAESREWTVANIPRVVGAFDAESLKDGVRFYSEELQVPVAKATGMLEAELSKLLENAHRLINIVFVSAARAATALTDIDFYETLEAAASKPFGYTPFNPGYAGGPCLVKDSVMLYVWMKSRNVHRYFTDVLRQAIIANEYYVLFLALRVADQARRRRAKKILIHGLGYKPGSRNFMSEDVNIAWRIRRELSDLGFDVRTFDPAIPEKSDFKSYEEAKAWADMIVGWGREGDVRLERI